MVWKNPHLESLKDIWSTHAMQRGVNDGLGGGIGIGGPGNSWKWEKELEGRRLSAGRLIYIQWSDLNLNFASLL